jgi:hypothetical protein
METRVHLPDSEPPATIREVVAALKKQKLVAQHDKQSWGDWINFEGKQTVISIESIRGLTTSATIEPADGEDDTFTSIIAAFRKLGWSGEDEDGPYAL